MIRWTHAIGYVGGLAAIWLMLAVMMA